MREKAVRKFRVIHDKSWAWHIGIFFCVEPKNEMRKGDMYLFFCVGWHDFSIGMITEYDEEN